ncbi:MAG: hypothetical protein M3512_14630 [Bacteroidota bacterium]|nr:hypothetical protein [Bacteroidota bacterium]
MNNITITPSDYRKYYLYQYYINQRFIVRVMRIIGGPILILMGWNFYTGIQYHIAISLFFIGYGIYYIIRPFLEIAIRNPKEESFSYTFDKNNLIIQDSINNTKMNLYDYPLIETSKYFYVHGENKKVVFFPKEKLDRRTAEEFKAKVTEI